MGAFLKKKKNKKIKIKKKIKKEVSLAYEKVKEVDALDITEEGQEQWDSAIRRYDERIERVEARMTARLRDQLGTAKNANEMFRIFSRFNALFVRPHIRGAIREYQTQLIQRVKDDIEALQEKFKVLIQRFRLTITHALRRQPGVAVNYSCLFFFSIYNLFMNINYF